MPRVGIPYLFAAARAHDHATSRNTVLVSSRPAMREDPSAPLVFARSDLRMTRSRMTPCAPLGMARGRMLSPSSHLCPLNEESAHIHDHEDEASKEAMRDAQEIAEEAQEKYGKAHETRYSAHIMHRIVRLIKENPSLDDRGMHNQLDVPYGKAWDDTGCVFVGWPFASRRPYTFVKFPKKKADFERILDECQPFRKERP